MRLSWVNRRLFSRGIIALLLVTSVGTLLYPTPAGATVDTFTTSGTWVAPTGVISVTVEVWGGGGGGGAARNNAGSGGGGGGYARSVVSVTPGLSYTYTVGTGGPGGTVAGSTAGPGTAGNPSWFSTTGTVFAAGGAAGAAIGGTAESEVVPEAQVDLISVHLHSPEVEVVQG
jgi:hypothetical protein